mmetsp:Transcript_24723/g.25144  ORF Transcript_24723/g.25144 Transcript_24723/m.25144 type:complete len:88 (+) Transcript_24723:772-1035(+)|eukprot:CAMPEP_0171308666 /NCGR_PEP_ID=MMETSP0816-20121228/18759_1 /TAXON_ID=420281 /ORGANISM="Proboscia inermis, Strain CCAP1064/1" /LENGTH=87 /DNA_ID=CAMNT_0011791671 /DNA_START=755 /DNA_END=1018 /DNA_ORIENTATION=+
MVYNEKKRLSISKKIPGNGTGAVNKNPGASKSNKMKQLTDQNKKYKLQIKALKQTSTNGNDDDDTIDDETGACGQFRGKASKKKKHE